MWYDTLVFCSSPAAAAGETRLAATHQPACSALSGRKAQRVLACMHGQSYFHKRPCTRCQVCCIRKAVGTLHHFLTIEQHPAGGVRRSPCAPCGARSSERCTACEGRGACSEKYSAATAPSSVLMRARRALSCLMPRRCCARLSSRLALMAQSAHLADAEAGPVCTACGARARAPQRPTPPAGRALRRRTARSGRRRWAGASGPRRGLREGFQWASFGGDTSWAGVGSGRQAPGPPGRRPLRQRPPRRRPGPRPLPRQRLV